MSRAEEGLLRALTRARMYIRKALKETGQFHEARDILLRANENATASIKAYRARKAAPTQRPEPDLTGKFEKVVQKNLERARKLPRFSKVERTETTFFGVYRNHTFDLRQEGSRNWWYIRVTAPCGSYDYDGWWKDSEDKTVDDAILEAMAGAGMELPRTAEEKQAAKRHAKTTFRKALAIAEGNLLLREDGYPQVPPQRDADNYIPQ